MDELDGEVAGASESATGGDGLLRRSTGAHNLLKSELQVSLWSWLTEAQAQCSTV